jgi:hypothetical protein
MTTFKGKFLSLINYAPLREGFLGGGSVSKAPLIFGHGS